MEPRFVYHFTGKERDAESGNDYFDARYYSSAMGRFMSPDWAAKEEPVPYATFDDPQSLNLYSYVRNNPLTRIDADGHYDWDKAIISLSTVAGTLGGALVGGTVGAGGGTLVAPGVGTVAGGWEGGALGAAGGAVVGAGIGKGIVSVLNSMSSSNQAPAPGPATAPAPANSSDTTNTNTNPFTGPVAGPVIVVDPKGNAIPVAGGQQLGGSKDGKWIQVKDANGKPTGTRVDGGHQASTHPDPAAQVPHAHVPGQTANGKPWLPVKQ